MTYIITPRAKRFPPFIIWDNAFNDRELEWLREKAKSATQEAKIGASSEGNIVPEVRRSSLFWLSYSKDSHWVFSRIDEIVGNINAEFYNFDLTCLGEDLQLTNYDSSVQGFYNWHQDFGAGPSRKLSFVCQLTDPCEYEGGNLEVQEHPGSILKVKKQIGTAVVFPSFMLHRVTPVTQGSRQSLVSWITGPQFK